MADKKITDLTELTAAASDDYLEIVDTSANTSKKISHENLTASHIPLTNFVESTPTVTGWSGTPAKQITYVVIGKLLLMSIYVSGTSDSTSTRVYLPTGITGATHGSAQWGGCRITDNGVTSATSGMAELLSGARISTFIQLGLGCLGLQQAQKLFPAISLGLSISGEK